MKRAVFQLSKDMAAEELSVFKKQTAEFITVDEIAVELCEPEHNKQWRIETIADKEQIWHR